jgi:hypothetical protein
MSFVEGVLSRGSRALFAALREARSRGCRFDAWSEMIDAGMWRAAFDAAGVDADAELHRARDVDAPLPWDHVRPGVSREFLVDEWRRAQSGETTPYCAEGKCNLCGVDPKLCSKQNRVAGADGEIGRRVGGESLLEGDPE